MKPDGNHEPGTMETTEPTESAAVAEPSTLQDSATVPAPSQPEEAANDTAPGAVPKANGKPVAAGPKTKPKAVASRTQPTLKSAGASGSSSRPGTSSHRTGNDVKTLNNVSTAAAKKMTSTAASKVSTSGAVPKRPLGAAAVSSTVKNQTRVPDKKPVGPTRTTSGVAASGTNGTKPITVNGTPKKRPVAETANVAKPKTTATTSRPAASTAPKPSTSTTTKAGSFAASRTTRPATAPSTTRPTTTTSRPTTATTKPPTTTTAKTAASRVTTAPSTGRSTAAQPPKTTAVKKDTSRPTSATVAKKPATATTSAATKKPEPSKPVGAAKLAPASKWSATTKAAEPKSQPQSKTSQPAKPTQAKSAGIVRFPPLSKPPLGRTPPASPASRTANGSTSQAKRGTKPTQTVPPFTAAKKTDVSNATLPAAAAAVAVVAAATASAVVTETQAEAAVPLPPESQLAASAPAEASPPVLVYDTPQELAPQDTVQMQSHAAAPSPPQSPVMTAAPQTSPPDDQLESSAPSQTTQERIPAATEATLPPVVPPPEEPIYLLTNQTLSTSKAPPTAANAISQIVPSDNLNDEEDEEEREGSQLVSMSEMSGATQPTEESRPGSAGLVGGAAWRASGALLSEFDSEDVSGSQQGASELSAPGVLEGTESMDDLGDGSLKGAIDMEGASAGSPDFEKVPDIPVNDFDEDEDDDDDDNDRVCDMDMGSERTDELQRPRDDNDVDDEEDEDVEMASEGVTESGLESYGNADEDDFAEDERLDNLNRVAQPPPPPVLPSAPAAQWDQPNPFADPWAEPLQPQQVLEHVSHMAGAAAASPLVDPWQADSETPTQTPAQAWLELGSAAPFVVENQGVPRDSVVQDEPQNLEAQLYLDQSHLVPMQTLAPVPLSAPGMSLSSTLSSETSTPEELRDYSRDGKLQPQEAQPPVVSPQPDLDYQDLGTHKEGEGDEGEEEAETLPADEVLGGPATAPTSNPSSSSVTEDEASDTEGEAQLDDSLESPVVNQVTFDSQPSAQRCLSTVEEGEEMEEGIAGEDTTPPSATSLASYGFDTMTTASNSNAQSTGESCIKSPGIFSLEELSEEAKDPCLIPQPHSEPCLAEQQYIECGKEEAESAEFVREEAPGSEETLDPSATPCTLQQPEENPDDIQPPYYSAICEKTENSFAGFTALPHPHRRDHAAYPRTYCDIVKPYSTVVTTPRLTCADLPPRSLGQQALSPQLRRLEQHQRQLLELQHRREQQSRPLEEAEQERKRREEEELRRKKEEAEEEIKRNKEEEERKMREQTEMIKKEEEENLRKEEEMKQRRDLELQLQQQQEELKQRQQIMQWQQELQQSNKGQTVLLSPSSGLCTIYEALENSDDDEEAEEEEEGTNEVNSTLDPKQETNQEIDGDCERLTTDEDQHEGSLVLTEDPVPHPDSPQTPSTSSQDGDSSSPCPPESPERPAPLDLDWGKKVDIVQQLINQTLLLNGDGCSSLLLMPGGAGGTLSPLESSLWPSLLPPLTPPSATVTSVSSFSPEATGSSPQGEWTVVELETHH